MAQVLFNGFKEIILNQEDDIKDIATDKNTIYFVSSDENNKNGGYIHYKDKKYGSEELYNRTELEKITSGSVTKWNEAEKKISSFNPLTDEEITNIFNKEMNK